MMIEKAKKIKMLILDVDGVFTDGKVNLFTDPDGTINEVKSFYAMDGLGIILLNEIGISSSIITGRAHISTEARAKQIGIKYLYQGFLSKLEPFNEIIKKDNLKLEEIAYIGDDIIDLPVLTRVGLACCPANSHEEVKKVCHLITETKGGEGCIREVVEIILKAQGKFNDIIAVITDGNWQQKPKHKPQVYTSGGTH
ncbi:YrbI family 3-deoxy-D-manno-octulosonate 8-phosphate phosphatase [Elusimicrobium posterum]|uniref:KdsC family phosphatase n=1 Tax=Elusimicrobium posterum TaxID=3116653 RepID=UPI003C790CE3